MNEWSSESMSHWISESKVQWTSDAMSQSISGSNESMNQWINESMNQWIIESMNRWTNEAMNQRMNTEKKHELMDGWMDGWVSYFSLLRCFSERPFRSGTSSLSYFFSEQPLIWATSALICLPASSSVASVTHDLRGAVTINAFSALQLQPRLLGASQHHSCCPACSCVIAFSHKLQWHWGRFRATRRYSDPISLSRFLLSVQSRAHFASLTFHKCLWRRHYAIWMCKSSSRHSPVHFLSATFPVRTSETKTLLRRPRKPLHAKKTHSFAFERSWECFSVISHIPELLHFPTNYTWW